MRNIVDSFKFSSNGIDFTVAVESLDQYQAFSDEWEMTDTHQGGVTVAVPYGARSDWKYAIPLQTTLAELTACYAKQGRVNPSREAYKSLQDSLCRDIDACDYAFLVSAEVDGVSLLEKEPLGCVFSYSYHDDQTLIESAKNCWDEYDTTEEALKMAASEAADIISGFDSLKSVASLVK